MVHAGRVTGMADRVTVQGYRKGGAVVLFSKGEGGYSVSTCCDMGPSSGMDIHSFKTYQAASEYYSFIVESIQDGTLFK